MRTHARIGSGLGIWLIVAGVASPVMAQDKADALQLAELTSLKGKVGSPDTRTRVDATHRVWSIGVANGRSDVKLAALALLLEPVDSGSDHIRMPAIYAIAEIAGTSADVSVKESALNALAAPLRSEQVPARNVATDAVNAIVRSGRTSELAPAALKVLAPAVGSGNNGVRIPAINAVVRAVAGSQNVAAYNTALDLLLGPLGSNAMVGGMEVRTMAIVAVERIGVDAQDVGTKAKAMGLAQSYVTRSGWEAEARKRASDAASAIQRTLK
jgi:hypothetical protein